MFTQLVEQLSIKVSHIELETTLKARSQDLTWIGSSKVENPPKTKVTTKAQQLRFKKLKSNNQFLKLNKLKPKRQ